MYSPSNFGLSADILKVVSSVMEEGRRITKENLAEQVASGVWNIEGQTGSVVSVYDTSSRTRFKLEVLDEMKMKNSDAALKLKKEISSLETSISKLTPLARKDDAANMKLVAAKKRLEAKKAEHSKLMKEESYKTSAGATEAKVVQAVGQIKHFAKEMYKGDIKKAYNDWAGKTTFGPVLKAEVLKRAGGVNEATDPVDKKELTKSFEKRKDKDIDNDGDTDSSDEYLHKRRKAISKAMKEESDVDEGFINLGGAKVKDDEKSILQHIKKTFPNVKKVKKDSQHGWIPVFEAKMPNGMLTQLKKAYEPMRDKKISMDNAKKLTAIMNKFGDDKDILIQLMKADIPFVSQGAVTRLISKHSMKGAELNKMMKEDEDLEEKEVNPERQREVIAKIEQQLATAKKMMKAASSDSASVKAMNNVTRLEKQLKYAKGQLNVTEGKKKSYKEEDDSTDKDDNMTDAQKNDMNGDGDKDKKKTKKKSDKDKVDIIDTDPEMKDDTMVQEARSSENRKMSSYEKEKLDDLKKKHEGGKMHRALRKNYGKKGDDIFYGKLTKMATGEYDGSDSKNEEFRLTVKDLNHLEELAMLGEGRPVKTDDADDGGSKNFIMQLRKAVSLRGQHTVVFDDGSKVKVDARKAQTFLDKFNSLNKPVEKETLMKSASKSPKHLDMALQGKVSKLSTGRRMPELPPLGSEKK